MTRGADPRDPVPGRCVRCGNDLGEDRGRCSSCALTDPDDPASAVWHDLGPNSGLAGYGGDLLRRLGHER